MKLRRYKRKAAAKVFLHLFAVLDNCMFQMSFNHLEWGEDLFTEKEREYISKLKTRVHTDAELCRQLAHKLRGSNASQ